MAGCTVYSSEAGRLVGAAPRERTGSAVPDGSDEAVKIDGSAVPALAEIAEVQPFDDGGVILNTVTGQLYSCNHVTMAFLEQVDGTKTIDAIAAAVAGIYDVSSDEVGRDLIEISAELAGENLLTIR